MRKQLWCSISILLILAGCGTAETTEESNSNTETEINQNEIKSEHDSEASGAHTSDDTHESEQKEADTPVNDSPRNEDQSISYTIDGQAQTELATLQTQSSQNYSMYVLPNYELTAEEPHKDIVFFKENASVFMRIEILPMDTNEQDLVENTKAQLKVVSEDIQETKDDPEWLQTAKGFTVSNGEDIVTSYIINNNHSFLKLSLYNKTSENHTDPLLKMAETIVISE